MSYKGFLFVAGFLAFSSMAGELNVSARQQDADCFKAVTSKLDPGGTSYLYFTPVNAYKMLREVFDGSRGLVLKNVSDKEQKKGIDAIFGLIKKLVSSSGITDIKGCGFSAIAINNDLYRGRGVLYAPERKGIIWDVTGQNRNFSMLNKLPENTAMAYYSQMRLDALWSWIKQEMAASNIKEKNSIVEMEQELLEQGIDLNKLLKSTTGEFGIVLTVDPDRKQEVTLKGQNFKISHFQAALFIGVNNDAVFKLIKSKMSRMLPPNKKPEPEDRILFNNLKFLPEFIKPVIANKGGYLFLASNPQLVDALTDGPQKCLVNTEKFKNLAVGIQHERGLSFSYANAELTNLIIEIQKAFSQNAPFQKILSDIQQFNQPVTMFKVVQTYDQGILSVFNCDVDPTAKMLVAAAIIPTTVLAGILAPALSKARNKAKSITTANNLKQLGLALKMYAMDHQDKFPPESGTGSLDILVKSDYVSQNVLKDADGSKYMYIGGLSETMSPDLPLIISIPKTGGEKNSVLFLDGHVEIIPATAMTDGVEVIRFLNSRYKYKEKDFQHLLEQARKLDSGMVK